MGRWLERPVPLKWFTVLILAYVATIAFNYSSTVQHEKKVDAFMQKGGRFTQEDAQKLENRIQAIEQALELEAYFRENVHQRSRL